MTNNVTKLIVTKPAPRAKSRKTVKTERRQAVTALMVGGVAIGLTALSLHDLASGVQIVTHAAPWQSYAMASGIDLGFISTELTMLTASEKDRKAIAKFTTPTVIGTLCGSAIMNAFAFASHADNLAMSIAAVAMGVAIPALIYAFTRIGANRWLASQG